MRSALVSSLCLVLALAAGCSCSSGTSPGADAFVATDTCAPPVDNPMRGHACTGPSDCPTGYTCRASFTASTTCELSCTPASAACVCPTGLSCEVPTGMPTGICS